MGRRGSSLRGRLQMDDKKRDERSPEIAAANSTDVDSVSPYKGFYVCDDLSNRRFLVDTGAFVSVFPASAEDRASRQLGDMQLVSANGAIIRTYGSREVRFRFAGRTFSGLSFLRMFGNRSLVQIS